MTKNRAARIETKVDTNETLRLCDRIIERAENKPDWDAYHRAVRSGSTKPWLYL